MFIAGDLVKMEEALFWKIQNKLSIDGNELKDNSFTVEADLTKEEDRVYIKGVLKNGNDKRYKIKSEDLSEIKLAKWDFRHLSFFSDLMVLNTKSKEVFDRLKRCDCRKSKMNYLDATPDGKMITYVTFDKYFEDEDYKKGRQSAKPIKVINKILKDNNMDELKQDEIDAVLSALEQKMEADFVVVSGKDISKYYNEKNYVSASGGSLHSSCMRYSEYSIYGMFEIYEDNAKMLILKERGSDKIYGRALIWELETENGEKYTLLDRIYCIKNSIVGLFINYANKNNMLYLPEQTYCNRVFYKNDKPFLNCSEVEVFVRLAKRPIDYAKFPYFDTIRKVDLLSDKAYVDKHPDFDDPIYVNNTNGSFDYEYSSTLERWCDNVLENNLNPLFQEYDREDIEEYIEERM